MTQVSVGSGKGESPRSVRGFTPENPGVGSGALTRSGKGDQRMVLLLVRLRSLFGRLTVLLTWRKR